ncbi:hypothetical protein [Mesorhizobium sp. BHbdii]
MKTQKQIVRVLSECTTGRWKLAAWMAVSVRAHADRGGFPDRGPVGRGRAAAANG